MGKCFADELITKIYENIDVRVSTLTEAAREKQSRTLSDSVEEIVKMLEQLHSMSNNQTKKLGIELHGIKPVSKEGLQETITSNKSKPEFDKLPSYVQGQKNMMYAGIGSRDTPSEVLEEMTKIAHKLSGSGYHLQSGGAIGADMAFEGKNYPKVLTAGSYDVKNKKGKVVLKAGESVRIGTKEYTDAYYAYSSNIKGILPSEWTSNKATPNTVSYSSFDVKNNKFGNAEVVKKIANEIHPSGKQLDEWTESLMARNTYQVFGKNLDKPVDFVLFYAKETDGIRPEGGTGQAVEMARLKGIPTINMANSNWKEQLDNIVKSKANPILTEELQETTTTSSKPKPDSRKTTTVVNTSSVYDSQLKKWAETIVGAPLIVRLGVAHAQKAMLDDVAQGMYTIEKTKPVVKLADWKSWKSQNFGKDTSKYYKQALAKFGSKEKLEEYLNRKIAGQQQTTTHELLHAVTVDWLDNNKDSELNKRLEKLFELTVKAASKLPVDHILNTVNMVDGKAYWKYNSREMLAEVLSTPELLNAFNAIDYSNEKRIASKLIELLTDVLSAAFGITIDSGKAAKELLDITAAVVEEGATTEWKASPILTEGVKQEQPTVKPKAKLSDSIIELVNKADCNK